MRQLVVLAAIATGCGDNVAILIDAAPTPIATPDASGSCWIDGLTPGGSMELGTGEDSFESLGDTLSLGATATGGFYLSVHTKMSGLEPGNPSNILDPHNPRTRVHAFFVATNTPLDHLAHCPWRDAYVQDSAGAYVEPIGRWLVIDYCWDAQHLIGQQVRLDAEIVDYDRFFATSSKTVTIAPPTSGYANDVRSPCM